MKRFLQILGPLLVLLVFLVAATLLASELKRYTLREIIEDIGNISRSQVAVAVVLTVVSYIILVGYDLLAVRFVGEKLSLWKIALTSFTSYAFSYNVGATLAGAPIRYRLYAGFGVPALKIVELLVILGLTFWFGLFFLAGVIFVVDPLQIPLELREKLEARLGWQLPVIHFELLGAILLIIAIGYAALTVFSKGQVKIFRKEVPVPAFKLTVCQYAVACADLIIAAAVLYAVLPPMERNSFMDLLGVYIFAYVMEVLTHVPGGWGVFELPMIYLLTGDKGQLFASVLVFRVIYRLVPVLIAAVILGVNELVLRKEALGRLIKAVRSRKQR